MAGSRLDNGWEMVAVAATHTLLDPARYARRDLLHSESPAIIYPARYCVGVTPVTARNARVNALWS